MSRFSKGQWSFCQAGSGIRYIYASERKQPICRPLQSASEIPREEFEANVALIEDAPRMYRLLADIVKAQDGTGKFSMEFLAEKAKALIAKHG